MLLALVGEPEILWTHCTGAWTIARMDWRDWELFCEIVQHGGFSAAGRVIGHPKSSLSAAVQRLESNLGLRLIERTTRHLRLTDAGETIYRRVRPLFLALHDTCNEAQATSSTIAGTLRIKSPYEFGAHHAGPVACELMSRYPDLAIRIDVEHEIVSPVVENYDIVFAMLEAPLLSAGTVIRRVFSLERGLFAAPALLESFGEPRTLEDLGRFPLLTGPNDSPWALTTPRRDPRASSRRESRADQFERPHQVAGGARRTRCPARDRQLYPRGRRSRVTATGAARPRLRAAQRACLASDAPIRPREGAMFPGSAGNACT
jgi:DNA-binding transcriptional LysR family regulator